MKMKVFGFYSPLGYGHSKKLDAMLTLVEEFDDDGTPLKYTTIELNNGNFEQFMEAVEGYDVMIYKERHAIMLDTGRFRQR